MLIKTNKKQNTLTNRDQLVVTREQALHKLTL